MLKKANCRRIHTRILLFQAGEDGFVDGKAQERFVRQTERAALVRIAGAKHEIYMGTDEIMAAYVGQVLDFFREKD